MTRRPAGPVDDTILILQPDHLGDILLAQPAVRRLRELHPDSRLVAVVGPWTREIAELAWPVDEITTVAYPGFTREAKVSPIAPYRQLLSESERLAQYRARAAYVFRPDAWWAAWLASFVSPEVMTSDDARCAAFATRAVRLDATDHASVRAMKIADLWMTTSRHDPSTAPLTVEASQAGIEEARRVLDQLGVGERYVAIHPGSGAAVKEWPTYRWAAVANALTGDGWDVVLTGSNSEAPLCDEIVERCRGARSLAGKTSIPVLAAVMQQASIVIGPDCGPLHLAVAVGTPTIHLFGPSDPQRYGPWGDPQRHQVIRAGWSCPKCGDLSPSRPPGCGCMLAIDVDAVIAAATAMLVAHDS
jgi:heptosyltransferase-2/heptosyltransferase-3